MRLFCTFALIGSMSATVEAQPLELSRYRMVDLTHPFNANTIYWPTDTAGFKHQQLFYGVTPQGFFYSAFSITTAEHGGTHLDAPIHFSDSGQTADRVPLERLIAAAVVIDVTAKAAANPDYLLTPEDVRQFEARHGRIPRGSAVLLRTDWSRKWPDRKAYLGDDTPGDASRLHFPSYGEEAATLLVNDRHVAALGADVASIDFGPSREFPVHRIAAAANVPGFENLTNLNQLPPTGAIIVALPVKIEGGSGGPLRAVALVPR